MTLAFILAKHIHVWCVILSYALFITRILWKSSNSPRLQNRWVKIAPHAMDTTLLITGVTMAGFLQLDLLSINWFSVKMMLLVSYIVIGILAMRFATLRMPLTALATAVFLVIIYLAANRPNL